MVPLDGFCLLNDLTANTIDRGKAVAARVAASVDCPNSTCCHCIKQPSTREGLQVPGPSTSSQTGWQPQPLPSHQLTLSVPNDNKPLS